LLSDYNFNERYLISTGSILEIYSKIDKNFPNVSLIIRDSINDSPVYLGFDQYTNGNLKDTITPSKKDYIYKTNEIERVYLNEVFDGKSDEIRYTKSNGDYELFYPYRKGKKIMILYFSENQRYGKIGS
jgi:hypothetical protein